MLQAFNTSAMEGSHMAITMSLGLVPLVTHATRVTLGNVQVDLPIVSPGRVHVEEGRAAHQTVDLAIGHFNNDLTVICK
jgi:hypothetical protein